MTIGRQLRAFGRMKVKAEFLRREMEALAEASTEAANRARESSDSVAESAESATQKMDRLLKALESVSAANDQLVDIALNEPVRVSDSFLALILQAYIKTPNPTDRGKLENLWDWAGGYNRFRFRLADILRAFQRTGRLPETFEGSSLNEAFQRGQLS